MKTDRSSLLFVGALLLLSSMTTTLFFTLAHAKTTWDQLEGYTYKHYVAEFGRAFASNEERAAREALFESRLAEVRRHNADPSKSWKQGVNQLTDRTEGEIRQLLGYSKGALGGPARGLPWKSLNAQVAGVRIAPHIDWREKGVVSPVKDQGIPLSAMPCHALLSSPLRLFPKGRCGSCWTFSAAETLESHWALATGQLPTLSEQHILDCVPNPDHCGGTGMIAFVTNLRRRGGRERELTWLI